MQLHSGSTGLRDRVMGNKTVDTHSFSNFEDYKAHLIELMELEVGPCQAQRG